MSDSEVKMDIEAFNRLFGGNQLRFIRFALSYVGDQASAEDIVMDSFMSAWERRASLTEPSFLPYTLTIVKHKCLNHLRAQGVRLRAAEQLHTHGLRMLQTRISTLEACNPEELFSHEARRMVEAALDKLSPRTREIITRSRFQGQSHKQIALEMNITVKSVEFEVAKAMKILRVCLRDYLTLFLFWFFIAD